MTRKVLVIFAHPTMHRSKINHHLVSAYQGIENLEFRELYDLYPKFRIQVDQEQAALVAADIIIWHHPFYWYNVPPLLKHWQDMVLAYGFAYGTRGDALAGKKLLPVITTGGSKQSYSESGTNRFKLKDLLKPQAQTAYHCGMEYLTPFLIFHAQKPEVIQKKEQYARHLKRLVQNLQNWPDDQPWPLFDEFESLEACPYINLK